MKINQQSNKLKGKKGPITNLWKELTHILVNKGVDHVKS